MFIDKEGSVVYSESTPEEGAALDLSPALIAMVIDHSARLRLGPNRFVVSCYTSLNLVILNTPILVTCVVARSSSSISSILELEPHCGVLAKELGVVS